MESSTKMIYIVNVVNWEYNDEFHYTEGSSAIQAFTSRQKAEARVLADNIKEFRIREYDIRSYQEDYRYLEGIEEQEMYDVLEKCGVKVDRTDNCSALIIPKDLPDKTYERIMGLTGITFYEVQTLEVDDDSDRGQQLG